MSKKGTFWLNTSILLLTFHGISSHHEGNKPSIIYGWHMFDYIPPKSALMANKTLSGPTSDEWERAAQVSECSLKVINIPCICLRSVSVSVSCWSDLHPTHLFCICAHVIFTQVALQSASLSTIFLCLLRMPLHICVFITLTCCSPQWDRCLGMDHYTALRLDGLK